MNKEFASFIIEYSEDDLEYIDKLIEQILIEQTKIMSFFGLKKFDNKVKIKIWNNVNKYERHVADEMHRLFHRRIEIKDWEVGRAITTKKENYIHLLTHQERIKRKNHERDTIEDMIKVSIHEFVHICHAQYNNYQPTLNWFNEALATILSNQYGNKKLVLDCTLEDFLMGKTTYLRYFTLGKYVFETYGKEYILELAKNNRLLESMTPRLFNDAKKWVFKKDYQSVKNPQELSKFMEFINYKWMDQNGLFHDELSPDMYKTYSLMTPDEVIENKSGICTDQVELERDWFEQHNYQYEVLNIQIWRKDTAPGHVLLIYSENNKWYWFENAWESYKGIHAYSTRAKLIEDVRNKFIIQNSILENELINLKIESFPKYPQHFSYEDMDNYEVKRK